jgi:hypothetical protein
MKNEHDVDKFIKLLNNLKVLEQHLGVNNVHNIVGKINGLEAEVKRLAEIKDWFIEKTETKDIGQAKSKVEAALRKAGANKVALAEKYNLDTSFLQGIGDRWDKQGEGRDQLKIFTSMEKKLEHQRRLVSESYSYMLELVEQKAEEAEYDYEQTLEVITAWHNEMEEQFHELTALEFWQEYKGSTLNLDLNLAKKEKTVELSEAKKYCEDYYPALLLSQTFANSESLGTVPLALMEKWGELYAKYEPITNPKDKRQKMFSLARVVMKKAIYRKAEGNTSTPTIAQDNLLEQLLTLDEFNSHEKSNELNENTQLDDILSEFISLSCQV